MKEERRRKEQKSKKQSASRSKKDVTGWTVVTRSKKHRKRTVQIFVKVDGGKTSAMEMEMGDKVDDIVKKIPISDKDVYVTSGGRILRRSDKLESWEVRDGSTIQVMSRMRGGGKHKNKKSKVDQKQAASAKTPEQKFTDEEEGDRGPAILESEKEAIIRMWEENEVSRKLIDVIPEGSEVKVEQALQSYRTASREVLGWDQGQPDMMERGLRLAVEAMRKGRRQQEKEQWRQGEQGQHPGQEQSKQGKRMGFGEEEQLRETRAKSTDEPEVMGRLAEARTGRGSAGLVRGGDERCRADETRKGKGKGNGGKGDHEGKGGGVGRKGTQQAENLVMDEIQENHREDVRKLVEMMQKEEVEKEEGGGRRATAQQGEGRRERKRSRRKERERDGQTARTMKARNHRV